METSDKKEKRKRESIVRAFLAQSVERAAFNRKVVGSSPTGGVFLKEKGKGGVKKKEKKEEVEGRIAQR